MNLIKVKGIVIRETQYKDNDKIITILTDNLGKVSCIAKGAKKTNSPILANAQYLVYNEFVLYKSKNFYYINSATVIDTFYNLRVDLDKLETCFELTRLLNKVTDENEDTSYVLKLFLNTLFILNKLNKDEEFVIAVFKIKLFCLIGFMPRIEKCSKCGQVFGEFDAKEEIYYDYVSNTFCCGECVKGQDKRRYIKLNKTTLIAIEYIITKKSLENSRLIFYSTVTDLAKFLGLSISHSLSFAVSYAIS